MFDGWTKPKFYTKCKSALRHTRTRLEPIRKKRVAVERFLKKDIADLLKDGLGYNAYLRADMLLVEQNMTACYDLLEQFCMYISNHLSDMQSKRECPPEYREAAASLAYAAARFADLPDLRKLRSLFNERYGNSFESFASKEFVEKLKADPLTKGAKLKLLQDMAQELSVEWDSKALEQKLFTPPRPQQNLPKLNLSTRNRQCDGENKNEAAAEPRRDSTSSSSTGTAREQGEENERPSNTKPSDGNNADARQNNPREVPNSKPKLKPKPISVRRRRRPLTDDNVGLMDEEERALDRLLLHYSTKSSVFEEGKARMAMEENGRPNSVRSMPAAPEIDGSAVRAHARSSSVELGGHVHPRMPDYDELAARIAALREAC